MYNARTKLYAIDYTLSAFLAQLAEMIQNHCSRTVFTSTVALIRLSNSPKVLIFLRASILVGLYSDLLFSTHLILYARAPFNDKWTTIMRMRTFRGKGDNFFKEKLRAPHL